MFASGSQLAQSRPSGTSAVSVFTSLTGHEVTRIVICNTSGASATYSIYHDDDGSTFDETTALFFGVTLGANNTEIIDFGGAGGGLHMAKNAQIAVQTGTGDALTFSLYGVGRVGR